MEIDHCSFPEDALYDPDNFVWAKVEGDKLARVGINSVLSSLAGRLIKVSLKGINMNITKGRSLGTIESGRYFGVVRSPITGSIVEINDAVVNNPKLINEFPYTEGWVSVIKNEYLNLEIKNLSTIQSCRDIIRSQIQRLHTKCFVAFPDHEMYEIGVECSSTLAKLDDLIKRVGAGDVIHIVSDDVTADLEMMRWSELRSQPIVEIRQENNLFHILVKKSS
jgi:glycine cleavage system H lipoate-binding protein/TusA-related sulfurtransferase